MGGATSLEGIEALCTSDGNGGADSEVTIDGGVGEDE